LKETNLNGVNTSLSLFVRPPLLQRHLQQAVVVIAQRGIRIAWNQQPGAGDDREKQYKINRRFCF
jgi:hypothetical protein